MTDSLDLPTEVAAAHMENSFIRYWLARAEQIRSNLRYWQERDGQILRHWPHSRGLIDHEDFKLASAQHNFLLAVEAEARRRGLLPQILEAS